MEVILTWLLHCVDVQLFRLSDVLPQQWRHMLEFLGCVQNNEGAIVSKAKGVACADVIRVLLGHEVWSGFGSVFDEDHIRGNWPYIWNTQSQQEFNGGKSNGTAKTPWKQTKTAVGKHLSSILSSLCPPKTTTTTTTKQKNKNNNKTKNKLLQ